MKLSAHFTRQEFLDSAEAARMGRVVEADDVITANLKRLCIEVLEPVRSHLDGREITITSGYRPQWLNQRIGGSRLSEHMSARAADFKVQGFTPFQVCRAISTIIHLLPVNQLIYEFGQWTHISVCAEGQQPRRQILTARYIDGKASYVAGIVP